MKCLIVFVVFAVIAFLYFTAARAAYRADVVNGYADQMGCREAHGPYVELED